MLIKWKVKISFYLSAFREELDGQLVNKLDELTIFFLNSGETGNSIYLRLYQP